MMKTWVSYKLQLKWYEYPKSLWTMKKWVLYMKRNIEDHIYKTTNSYWFNSVLLQHLPKETVIVITEKQEWVARKLKLQTTVWDILNHNDYKTFIWKDLEIQNFYPINSFKRILK